MGAWGTAVFSNDTASDVRSEFRDLIADGVDPQTATDRLVESYQPGSGTEDAADFWLGLALAQHRLGRLLPDVQEAAFRAAEQEDLGRWEEKDRPKRVSAVRKALEELAQPQPEAKPVRNQPKDHRNLEEGQHFLYDFRPGRKVLFRVAEVDGGPTLTLLAWKDSEPVPTGDALLQLAPAPSFDGRPIGQGFNVYGSKDPSSRITMLPERGPVADHNPPRRRLPWWLRRASRSQPRPWQPAVSWRALPRWFTDDGEVSDPTT